MPKQKGERIKKTTPQTTNNAGPACASREHQQDEADRDAGAAALDVAQRAAATPACLARVWQKLGAEGKHSVALFYQERPGSKFREFSNFFKHEPFAFELPRQICRDDYPDLIACEFSELAIMACKAVLFDDKEIFTAIIQSQSPSEVKKLGRAVRNFDEKVWQENVLCIAESVVTQKFAKIPGLARVLKSTGSSLIAEAAPRDCVWGIGLAKTNDLARHPARWNGTNVLGWALMRARKAVGGHGVPGEIDSADNASAGKDA
jgi:hypothetical protein